MKMRRCEDEKMICEDVKMRRCEDEKMIDRPPLLEEPFAQTLSGKMVCVYIYIHICIHIYTYIYIHVVCVGVSKNEACIPQDRHFERR